MSQHAGSECDSVQELTLKQFLTMKNENRVSRAQN